MKRNFTLLLLSLFSIFTLNGQNHIKSSIKNNKESINEGFESWPAENWTTYITQQGSGWVQGVTNPYEGSAFATKVSEMEIDSDDWLVSPKFTVKASTFLEFYERNKWVHLPTFQEHGVYISIGSGDPKDGDFVLLKNMSKVHEKWNKAQFNLSGYAEKEVYIGFHYIGNFASDWEIDALRVFEKPDYEIAALDIITPNFVNLNDKVTPKVKVINLGKNKMSNARVSLSVNGTEELKTVSLEPEEIKEVAFSEITIEALKQLEAKANFTGDVNPDNNTKSCKIHILNESKAYAYCIYSKDKAVPMGPVSFQTKSPETIASLENKCKDYVFPFGGTMINNLWFANISKYSYGDQSAKSSARTRGTNPMNYSIIDLETGELLNIASAENAFEEMAYNKSDDFVYAINNLTTGQMLYKINYKTGETNEVALRPNKMFKFITFAIDQNGNAYGIGPDKCLHSINLSNFTSTKIGATGAAGVSSVQSMAFDHTNNVLYWCQYSNTSSIFYAVDTETGKATSIGNVKALSELTSLGFVSGETKHYSAFRIKDNKGNLLKDIKVTIDGQTLISDFSGIATFIGLDATKTHDYKIAIGDNELASGTVKGDETKIIDITLNDLEIYDAAITSIETPEMAFEGDKKSITVNLVNKGYTDIKAMKVTLNNGETSFDQNIDLAINSTVKVEFKDISILKGKDLKCDIELENDTDPDNNTLSKSITVLVSKKAYAYSIFSKDDKVVNGPANYEVRNPGKVTSLEKISEKNVMAKAGTMIHNYWFVNNVTVSREVNNKGSRAKINAKNFALLDLTTGQQLHIAPTDKVFVDMAYNYTNNKLYGICEKGDIQELYTIDYKTGVCTLVGSLENITTLMTFAIDSKGNAYAIGFNKNLFSVNLEDFTLQYIGKTGVSAIQYSQSMAFDHENDILYWNLSSNTDGELYYVNTSTGKANLIGEMEAKAEMVALGFPYTEKEEKFYLAFHTYNRSFGNCEDIEITLDDKIKITNEDGIAVFLDLKKDETYKYRYRFQQTPDYKEVIVDKSKTIEIRISLGLNEISNNLISIYPNPSSGQINIKGMEKASQYSLINSQGQIIYSSSDIEDHKVLNLDNLPKGFYTLNVLFNDKIENHKIILK
ncbi:MAG: choice-of-anchor J domain-containing protein [Bacteroidales bacterium]